MLNDQATAINDIGGRRIEYCFQLGRGTQYRLVGKR